MYVFHYVVVFALVYIAVAVTKICKEIENQNKWLMEDDDGETRPR